MTALDVAVDPDTGPEPGLEGRVPIELVEPDGRWLDANLYVATPALLARYGVDLDAIDPDTEILTVETGDLAFIGEDLDQDTPSPGDGHRRPDSHPHLLVAARFIHHPRGPATTRLGSGGVGPVARGDERAADQRPAGRPSATSPRPPG